MPPRRHPITTYAERVCAGRVPAGALHRASCARHLADLSRKRGPTFDAAEATKAIAFFPKVLRHYKGEWAGQPIELEPWQAFIVGSLDGWRRTDGRRRFRTAFVEVPRGQGKSTIAGGLALKATFFDGEPGADGFCVATKKDQARIVFEAARQMVLSSTALRKRIEVERHQLLQESSASKLLPLGSDADTLDGLRPHIVIADEVHAHKTASVIELMQTGMGTRRQPLLFEITTAGQERLSVWWQHREYSRQLLEGVIEDETWFGFIACADDEDDWQEEATWRKANPNYGVSVKPEYIAAECRKAINLPAYEPTFRRLHLGQLVEQDTRLVSRAQWDACGEDYGWEAFVGRPTFAGLDLSKTTDLTACVWLTTDADGTVRVWPQVWIPESKLTDHTDRVPYRTWASQGWVTVTPGNVVDYARVRADILDKARTCTLRALGFDPWNATETSQQLGRDLGDDARPAESKVLREVRQGYVTMNEPTQKLLALLAGRQMVHPRSPVLTWAADNLQVTTDAAGNLKPDKGKSRQRIDPIVALLNALHLWIRLGGEPKSSTYDSRPVLIL
jgi:phage terminase large subunit-like protein